MAFLTATISKTGASVSSLRYKGHEMVTNNIYYSMDGGQNYRHARQLPAHRQNQDAGFGGHRHEARVEQ